MKKLLTVLLLAAASIANAQWANTTNQFYDSLDMPVTMALSTQKNPLVLKSYPDGGYFVIWEDDRNTATTKTDIYAQKYDKNGNRLWADNGVPVVNGPNAQFFAFSSNQDYRNRNFAATDSAGGFYLTYIDDSINNYSWQRIAVQHMLNNGSPVFPGAGFLVAQTPPGQQGNFAAPQLIADDNKGFFIAYKYIYGNDYIEMHCYKDVNGTMQYFGGGRCNENGLQTADIAPCGIKTDILYPGTSVTDYNIWPDKQGGCNVVISMNGNSGAQGKILAYNRLFRPSKDCKVKTNRRNETGVACPAYTDYKKGNVYLLYKLSIDFQKVACGGGTGPLYTYTNYRLLSNGYQEIDIAGYDYNYPKGVTLTASSNMNADLIAVTKRTYANNTVSDFVVVGFAYRSEIFDSIPFQRSSYSNPDFGYNPIPPNFDSLEFFRDTLLGMSNYYPDFSLAGGGKNIYAAGLMGAYGARTVRLQNLQLQKKSGNTYAFTQSTSTKLGEAIGKEISTGFSSYNISYDQPLVSVNSNGKAIFYIREYYRSTRVSPIGSGAQLTWGAMGLPVGTGVFNNSYYNVEQPNLVLDDSDNTGVVAWRDNRYITGTNTGENIYMRHLGNLDVFNYQPPVRKIRQLYYTSTNLTANPAVLFGTTSQYSPIEFYNSTGTDPGTSPVAAIKDDNNIGILTANIYQHVGAIRKYNGIPYLNRNYTFKSEFDVSASSVDMLLYFTTAEYNALKAADNTIADPSFLSVIKQPNLSGTVPGIYTPVAGEEILTPVTWDSVAGGYFVKIVANGLGNYFIQKINTINLCGSTSTTITSNVTGSTYQWQVNSGGGFFNISNGTNYSGTNGITLQLNNVPTAFNGNRYRCVIDGTKVSSAIYLQIANSWTGAVSSAWENAANWGCGVVPDANTDVIINSGTVVVNSNASCKSLKVNPGASVTVSTGFKLTVTN
ncbi:MAG: hypothetical protein ABJB11_14875 [Ferruginibacter sp.]